MSFIPAPHAAARPDRKQITLSQNTANYNLANDLTNNHDWNGTSPIDVEVTVDPSVHVQATAATTPAFVADLVSGSKLTLINNGVISGKGGAAGSAGGHAISLKDVDATVVNVPGKNLMLRSQLFNSGSWAKVGSPTVDADVTSVNMLKQSQTIQSGYWQKLETTVTTPYDKVVAPDGTKTAEGVAAFRAGSYQHRVYQATSSVPAYTSVTGSIYVKAGAQNWVSFTTYGVFAQGVRKFVNLATGAIGADTSFNNPLFPHFSVEDAGNGWYRIIAGIRTSSLSAGVVTMTIQLTDSDGNLTYDAGANYAADQIYLWGGQIELGTVASNYEETGATANPPIASPINGIQSVERITRTTTASTYLSTGTNIGKASTAQTFTSSIYARRSIGDYFSMRLKYSTAYGEAIFNLKTGKVHNTSQSGFTNTSAQIESVGGGFYRCVVTSTTTATPHAITDFSFSSNGVGVTGTDSALSSGYVWGFQCELTPQRNYYNNSEDLTASGWSYNATITADAAVNPVNGAKTADSIVRNSSTNGQKREQTVYLGTGNAGNMFIHSVYIKNINATQTRFGSWDTTNSGWTGYVLLNWSGAVPTPAVYSGATNAVADDVGNGWYRVSYEQTPASGSNGQASGITCETNAVNGNGVYAYGFQFEQITADGKPSPYIPVSRNLLDYPETPSKLFTTHNSNTITDNYDIAPDGTMTAALVADNSTTVGTFMQRNISIPDDSSKYTWSFYVKKDQNVARFPVFWLNFYGNSLIYNHMNFNTKTGEIFNAVASTGRLTARSVSAGDYWRVSMTVQNDSSGNNGIAIRVDPVKVSNFTTSVFGASDVTMTGSIIFWGSQLEKGAKNLVSYPEDFSNSYWTKVNGATAVNNPNSVNIVSYSQELEQWNNSGNSVDVLPNALVAPDGTHTAAELRRSPLNASALWANRMSITGTCETSTVYTVSAYFRQDSPGTNRPMMAFINPVSYENRAQVAFVFANGTPTQNHWGGSDKVGNPVFTNAGNGWWRVSFQVMTDSSATDYRVAIFPNGGYLGYDPVGVWGVQVQKGSVLSDYEPTGATAAPKMLAPNNTETANLLTAGSGSYGGLTARKYLPTSDIEVSYEHTLSVYVKKINHRYIHLRHPSSLAVGFDFDTLSFIGGASATSKTVEDVGDGWYRISVSFAQPAGANTNAILDLALADSTGASSANSVSGGEAFYAWGLQFERGPLTDYEEASNYIAIGNKATRYRYRNYGVTSYTDQDAKIYAGGGGGGAGGSTVGHGSSQDQENACSGGTTVSGGAGGTGAGPATTAATSGSSNSPGGTGGNGGSWGVAGSSGSTATGSGCAVTNHGGSSGGAAGKAIHLVSNATLTLRNTGQILGATS